jgi:hypothetical protein
MQVCTLDSAKKRAPRFRAAAALALNAPYNWWWALSWLVSRSQPEASRSQERVLAGPSWLSRFSGRTAG